MATAAKITGFACAMLLLACLIVAAVWPLPVVLIDRVNNGSLTAAERLKAINEVRIPLIGILAGVAAIATVVVGLRTYKLTKSGQFTDRYSRAVEQVGSDKLSTRLGGIYALERLARDSEFDRKAVADVLSALVRQSNPEKGEDGESTVAPDAQAALTVLGSKCFAKEKIIMDLRGARLGGADFRNLQFRKAKITNADLSMAQMEKVDLRNSDLSGSDFRGSVLNGANLSGALLADADLRGVSLQQTVVTEAELTAARID